MSTPVGAPPTTTIIKVVSQYKVDLPQFEGPLDLLLSLVDKEKLDITEISLARVAQQYRHYLESLDRLNLEIESSYIVVFAQLLEIKSRVLLPPVEEEDPGYDNDFSSPADGYEEEDLVEQLKAYKLVKEAADWLAKQESLSLAQYPHPCTQMEPEWLELDVSLEALVATWVRLDTSVRAPRQAVELQKVQMSVPDRALQIFEWIKKRTRGLFSQLLGTKPSRSHRVVSFLALLELLRRSRVRVHQENWESDLEIEIRQELASDSLVIEEES